MNYLFVFVGGGFGSLIRFFISIVISKTPIQLPIATLLSNTISCLLFGGFIYLYQEKNFTLITYYYFCLPCPDNFTIFGQIFMLDYFSSTPYFYNCK